MIFYTAISILALAALSPSLYDCFQRVSIIYQNAPERLLNIDNLKSYEIKFADKIRSCEDVLLVESKGLAIVACDPGRESRNTVMGVFLPGDIPNAELFVYNYKDAGLPDSESLRRLEIQGFESEADFHTLGIAYDEKTSVLFVTNHRKSGPTIEMFNLDLVAFKAKHFRTIRHPLLRSPNSIALINSHELLVTSDHYFQIEKYGILAGLETYLGLPIASVVHVDISPLLENPAEDVRATVVAHLPFANGIDFINETTVVAASTSNAAVYFYTISKPDPNTASAPTLTYKSMVKFPFFVDNIQVSQDGTLFVAGHPHPPSLNKFTTTRNICNSPTKLAAADPSAQEYCNTGKAPSWISKWTEAGGIEHLYVGSEYPTSTTAAFDSGRNIGIVTGLYSKGLLVWRS
ncbi:hypothetical protein GGS26DRAFT_132416 [Hypomontagnella submonticulosa]|nr:hypothetical protein GGS26DRAFT_132416 [Hypomontagnella submonticulosa]